jgi:uncharacterized membrane protein YqhA
MVVIHLVFIASGVMLAYMDKFVATTASRHQGLASRQAASAG